MRVTQKATTKPRGEAWYPGFFVHEDTEIPNSTHDACGSPIRNQFIRTTPPVITDETAIVTSEGAARVCYCPKCNVRVVEGMTTYETDEL